MRFSLVNLLAHPTRTAPWTGPMLVAGLALAACGGGAGAPDLGHDDAGGAGSSSGGAGSGSGSSSGGAGSSSGGHGGSSSGSASSSGSSSGATSDGASLTIEESDVAGSSSTGGAWLFHVSATLANVGSHPALPASYALLSLATDQHVLVIGSPSPSSPCAANLSLQPGGHVTCGVVFSVPAGQMPASVVYDDRAGDEASTPVALTGQEQSCAAVAGFSSMQTSAQCSECLSEGGKCGSKLYAFDAQCNACASGCSVGRGDCACAASCPEATCPKLYDAWIACAATACASACK